VGNIYASEALFRAGIKPDTKAGQLTKPRLIKLLAAIKEVLTEAIEAGGTTIQNFTSLNSQVGYFARSLNVYDQAGELCNKCGKGRIKRTVIGGRSTFYCAVCQR
jgi:formamidopyrimidine-DNA glycosylase